MKAPQRITPCIKAYAWGDPRFLPELLALAVYEGPCAEAWYGAHPSGPALAGDERVPLDEFLRAHGADFFGRELHQQYQELPYLLKLLAAARPLSVQVHPNQQQAAAGFVREQQSGIPRDAAARSYKDANAKPEALVALTEFHALCGFRQGDDLRNALSAAGELTELVPGEPPTSPGELESFLRAFLELPDAVVNPAIDALLTRLEKENAKAPFSEDQPTYWALIAKREVFADARADRGIVFVFLLEYLRLEPGQAMFLAAGVPHAYLRGSGIELMGSSDNVLRAGLTSKHVDTDELLRVVRFDASAPPLLEPLSHRDGIEARYHIPAAELDLRRLRLGPGQHAQRVAHGPRLMLALPVNSNTAVHLCCGSHSLELQQGQACLIPHGAEYSLRSDGPADVFVAGLPEPELEVDFRGRRPTELSFGTSGLRGLVTDITDLEAYINTRGFIDYLIASGDAVPGAHVALGGDLRPSTHSPERSILRAVAQAVRSAGLTPVYCGKLPTPALAFYAMSKGWPSVMVTGSHIPFDRNGIKFNKSLGEVLKDDEAPILAAVARVRALEYSRSSSCSPFDDHGFFTARTAQLDPLPSPSEEAKQCYKARYQRAFSASALRGLELALYEHSAVGRELIADILRSLGANVLPVGRSERFVAIDTEAISADKLAELQALTDQVWQSHGPIDAVISTDGDSDRPLLLAVDAQGKAHFVPGDLLGALVAEALQADSITVPVSSSDAIELHFSAQDGAVANSGPTEHVTVKRTKIGSPWVIAAMIKQEGKRKVGWEANGGFMLGSTIELSTGTLEPLPTRDALLPLVAVLDQAQRSKRSLIELTSALPSRFSRAGLLDAVPPERSRALSHTFGLARIGLRSARFDGEQMFVTPNQASHAVEREADAVEREANAAEREQLESLRFRLARHFNPERGFGTLRSIDALDGIRLKFAPMGSDRGDIAHVRPSGNAPQLRMYAVADSTERAEAIVAEALREPDGLLRELLAASTIDTLSVNI